MYTMDYVSHVLSLQGWERCDCINDYMTGSEPTSNVIECSSQYLMKKTQNFLHRVSQPAEKQPARPLQIGQHWRLRHLRRRPSPDAPSTASVPWMQV